MTANISALNTILLAHSWCLFREKKKKAGGGEGEEKKKKEKISILPSLLRLYFPAQQRDYTCNLLFRGTQAIFQVPLHPLHPNLNISYHLIGCIWDICCFQHSRASTVEKQLLIVTVAPLLLNQKSNYTEVNGSFSSNKHDRIYTQTKLTALHHQTELETLG